MASYLQKWHNADARVLLRTTIDFPSIHCVLFLKRCSTVKYPFGLAKKYLFGSLCIVLIAEISTKFSANALCMLKYA